MRCLLFPQSRVQSASRVLTEELNIQIAEEVETQLQNYKRAVEEINKKTVHQSNESASQEGQLETQNLMAAVSSLPELTEKKKVLDKHTSIATTLLNIIKDRFCPCGYCRS